MECVCYVVVLESESPDLVCIGYFLYLPGAFRAFDPDPEALHLITGLFLRATLFLLFLQMLGTLTPLILFPDQTFVRFPYAPTLEGQYIIKNMVLVSAALVVGSTVRGGRIVAEPGAVVGKEVAASAPHA